MGVVLDARPIYYPRIGVVQESDHLLLTRATKAVVVMRTPAGKKDEVAPKARKKDVRLRKDDCQSLLARSQDLN